MQSASAYGVWYHLEVNRVGAAGEIMITACGVLPHQHHLHAADIENK
jgi:hypothetical protein